MRTSEADADDDDDDDGDDDEDDDDGGNDDEEEETGVEGIEPESEVTGDRPLVWASCGKRTEVGRPPGTGARTLTNSHIAAAVSAIQTKPPRSEGRSKS